MISAGVPCTYMDRGKSQNCPHVALKGLSRPFGRSYFDCGASSLWLKWSFWKTPKGQNCDSHKCPVTRSLRALERLGTPQKWLESVVVSRSYFNHRLLAHLWQIGASWGFRRLLAATILSTVGFHQWRFYAVGAAKFSVLIGKANESHDAVRTVRVWARQPEASLDTAPARWITTWVSDSQ